MASAVLVTCLVIAAAGVRPAEGIRRHHRHRRDPDPVGEERVQKPNLYKPKFEDCETYEPAVEEGSRKGKNHRDVRNLWVLARSRQLQGVSSGDSTLRLTFFLRHHLKPLPPPKSRSRLLPGIGRLSQPPIFNSGFGFYSLFC